MASPVPCAFAIAARDRRLRRLLPAALAACLLIVAAGAFSQESPKDAGVVVVVDESRGTMVRWVLPSAGLPAGGFRLDRRVDGGPAETIATVRPGQTGVVLSPVWKETAEAILKAGGRPEDRASAIVLTLAEPQVAAWLGLSYEDRAVRPGTSVAYTVSRLAADGRVEAIAGTSMPVPVVPMRPPAPPSDFQAKAARYAVEFYWTKPPSVSGHSEALLYEIRREDGTVIGDGPLLKISTAEKAPGAFDLAPGSEVRRTYTITALDIFGRRGPTSAPVTVFAPDFTALDPPKSIDVTLNDGKALLSWSAPDNPNRKGWRVVRTLGASTYGQTLTPQPQQATRFEDPYVPAGVTVRYRVSAVNRRDEEGKPRVSRPLDLPAPKPAPAPQGLTVELTARRLVVLRWVPPAEPVAGYYVERSRDGKHWTLLKGIDGSEPRFVDDDPPAGTAPVWYRVIAWGRNDVASAPSVPIEVSRPPASPPLALPDFVAPPAVSLAMTTQPAAPAGEPPPPVQSPPLPPPAATSTIETQANARSLPIPSAVTPPAQTIPAPRTEAKAPDVTKRPAEEPAAAMPAVLAKPVSPVTAAPATPAAASQAGAKPPVMTTPPVAPPPVPAVTTAAVVKPPVAAPAAPAAVSGRPATPTVSLVDGSGGKVSLRFSLPPEANGFFIFRSESPDRSGNVIASGLLANGRGAFVDTSVVAGQTYYYRLVAVDAAGNRSPMLDPPATVRVAARR